jgi:TPR repeat protein
METAFLTHFRLNALTVLLCATFTLRFNLTLKALEPDIPHSTGGKEPGSIQQQIELAAAYLTGRGVNRDEKMGAYWYEKAAAAGQPRAQEQIGYFYQIGLAARGVSSDSAAGY